MDFSRLTAFLDQLHENYHVPGFDIRILQDHREIYRHMGGCSDHAGKKPITGDELYDVYSASKVLTMTAAMQLIEQGKMHLDDPVADYLPEFASMMAADRCNLAVWPPDVPTLADPCHPAKGQITLRMLMSMTAGLNYDTGSAPIRDMREKTRGQATTRDMMRAIAQMPLRFDPGTHYAYSFGHDVIAGVIEVVSGESFGAYMRNHLFDPLGVKDMYYHVTDDMLPRMTEKFAGVMGEDGVIPVSMENIYRLSDNYESGGAGVACTVEAYSTVIDALACGGVGKTGARILTMDSIRQMSENQLTSGMLKEFQDPFKQAYGYGLGVRTVIRPELTPSPLGEFGWDGAAGAYALIDPVNRLSIFYAQEVLAMMKAYSDIHPQLRNLTYEALKS